MSGGQLCNSLIKWLETFPDRSGVTASQLSDGVVMAQVLHQIAPEFFDGRWLVKIKPDTGENWRLKVSNLRKLQQGIIDYYQEQLGQNIRHFPVPDLNQIAEHNEPENLGRLLQLILGCAVNCERKQHHIEAIMSMEESVQAVIMGAIQELMTRDRESSPGVDLSPTDPLSLHGLGFDPASFHPHLKTVMEQLETTTLDRDETVKRCHALEQQLSMLNEEKAALYDEKERMMSRLEDLEGTGGEGGASTLRYKDLKKQIDTLQDDLYKIETSRDEYRVRVEQLERENQEVQARNDELHRLAEEARSLKDEVDALTEMREKVSVYEGNMEAYKKKLEELSDLKRQVKILEDKNADYVQHNMELEEEVKKSGTWRPQLDLYKKQVADMHQKLSEEAKKTDRQVFENKKLVEKMEAGSQERERLSAERDAMRETIEEMKCQISTLTSPDNSSRLPSDLSDADMLEAIPHEIREKLMRLQHENKMLKKRSEASEDGNRPVLQAMLSDLQDRHTQATQENRGLNQRIMELESEVEDIRETAAIAGSHSTGSPGKSSATEARKIVDLERKLMEQMGNVTSLEECLSKKESEMARMEERYKKYLGKAKGVIKALEPKHNPNLVPDVSTLRATIHEKEQLIENMARETEKAKMVRDMEEKLMTTAFYNFGMQMHRNTISQRLSAMDQGQSFLSRQRQTSTRRVPMNNPMGNSEFYDYYQLDVLRIS
ncbi:unnamed protein product, partial [Meganyctiphanes norvegica]